MPKSENHNNADPIQQQVEEVISAGALGRSDAFVRLLKFLAAKAETQKSVKEIEIAIEVFGRDETFDVTQDSLVRVYIHKLRTKLDSFYRDADSKYVDRLVIPKGSYLLKLEKNSSQSAPPSKLKKILNRQIIAIVFFSLLGTLAGQQLVKYVLNNLSSNDLAIGSPIWSPLVDSPLSLLVVIGDQFVFSEVTQDFEQLREVRDFSINNSFEFEQRLNSDPDFSESYRDFGVRYLPSALALALKDFSTFSEDLSNWRIILASQLDEHDLKDFNILYIGYYTALDQLAELAFESSSLQLHPNGSLLIQEESGEVFVGTGQLGSGFRDRYIDYSVLRKVSLESGNTLFALMSARDPGLENLASFVFSKDGTAAIESRLENPEEDFEMLLEVSGTGQDDLISQIRTTAQ